MSRALLVIFIVLIFLIPILMLIESISHLIPNSQLANDIIELFGK